MLPLATLLLGLAQTPAPQTDVASLERVRRGLEVTPGPLTKAATEHDAEGRPIFRVHIDGFRPLDPRRAWDPWADTSVPSYLRPRFSPTHYEFLRMVTPEDFHAGVLHTQGIDLLALFRALSRSTNEEWRRREEARIRRQIKEELAAFKKANGIP